MKFSLRFNLRNPEFAGVRMADRYEAALEMAEWADNLGATWVSLSEHHGAAEGMVPDGILPSPVVFMAAIAARTKNVRLLIAALVAPFYEPLRLAEDLAVLDQIANGRLEVVIGAGHDPLPFTMFGVEMRERARRTTETVTTLKKAFTGEPFEFRGRTVQITPTPCQPGGPPVLLGGNSEAAARRAARIADGFFPGQPACWPYYVDELAKLGKPDPGPPEGGFDTILLAEDPEAGWERAKPYFFQELEQHWAAAKRTVTEADIRQFRVITPAQLVEELQAAPEAFPRFNPMCGGAPPELGWETLRLFERDVLPKFR